MEFETAQASTDGSGSRAAQAKSPGRMRYEAEVSYLKRQNGDLEQIRQKLGLSRRKIAQLLLVDPSAWTRWTSSGGDAPPHVYQALDWYLAILEKDPEYRRLSKRFMGWMNDEKEYAARLEALEKMIHVPDGASRARRDLIVGAIAFFVGMLCLYVFQRA